MKKRLLLAFQLTALAFVVLSGWGWIVFTSSNQPHRLPEPVTKSATWIAKFPNLVRKVIKGRSLDAGPNKTGIPVLSELDITNREQHLLVSKMSEEHGKATIKLIRLYDEEVVREWVPDYDEISRTLATVTNDTFRFNQDMLPRMVVLHDDMSIAFIFQMGPLVRLDPDAKLMWVLDGPFHHSIEVDAEGYYWLPMRLRDSDSNERYGIQDDAVARVSPSGEIVYTRSLFDLFMENGLRNHLVGYGLEQDPVHLNDIQPAMHDGPYWQRGDLLLSLRHMSMVLLFRPSADAILWRRTGTWLNQHDIDFVDSTHVAWFGNDNLRDAGSNYGQRTWNMAENSDFYLYDFASDEVTKPYAKAFAAARVRTETQGRSEIQPDGSLFVSETDAGRHLLLDSVSTRWEFVETNEDGRILLPDWVRLLKRDEQGRFVE